MTEQVKESQLQELFVETVKGITKRVSSDEACAADFNAAISLLKHNNITVSPDTSDQIDQLNKTLEEKRARRKARIDGLTQEEINNVIPLQRTGE